MILLFMSIAGLFIMLWLLPDMAMEYFGPAFISEMQRNLLYYIHPFIIGIGLSWLWHRLRIGAGGAVFVNSLKFGLAYAAVATLPYMLLIYSAIDVSLPVVITWLLFGYAEAVIASLVLYRLNIKR